MERLSRKEIRAALLDVHGKVHLLEHCNGEDMNDLQKIMEVVDDNISSISKITIASLCDLGCTAKNANRMIKALTLTFMFILRRCVDGQGGGMKKIVIKSSYVEILSDFESVLVGFAFYLRDEYADESGESDDDGESEDEDDGESEDADDGESEDEDNDESEDTDDSEFETPFYDKFEQMIADKDLLQRVAVAFEAVVSTTSTHRPSNVMISKDVDSAIEYLMNYSYEHNEEDVEPLMEPILIKFLQITKEDYWMMSINHEKLQQLFMGVEAVLHLSTYYVFATYCMSVDDDNDINSALLEAILKSLMLKSASSPPPFTDELLMGFADCIQLVLVEMHWISRDDKLTDMSLKFSEKLGYLVRFFIGCTKRYNEQEQQSDLRIDFQTHMVKMASIVCSFLKNEEGAKAEEINHWLYRLSVLMMDALIMQLQSNSSLADDELMMEIVRFFRIILPFMLSTKKSGPYTRLSTMTNEIMATEMGFLLSDMAVKIHKDLSQAEPVSPVITELLWLSVGWVRNFLNLMVTMKHQFKILHQLLLSVVHLLINYGKHYVECGSMSGIGVCFHKVVGIMIHLSKNGGEENLATGVTPGFSEMLLSILRIFSLQLEFSPPLAGEHLMRSLDFIQQILNGLLKEEDINLMGPKKDQLLILNEDLKAFLELLMNYHSYIEKAKLFDDRIQLQTMALNLGSLIHSSFNNEMRANMATETNIELPDLIEKVNHTRVQFTRIIPPMILNRLRQTSPCTNLIGFLNFLLVDLKELIDCKLDSVMLWKDEFQTIHDGIVVFSSFLQKVTPSISANDTYQALAMRIRNAAYEAEYLINSSIVGAFDASRRSTSIYDLTEEIKLIKAVVLDHVANTVHGINKKDSSKNFIDMSPPTSGQVTDRSKEPMQPVDTIVGFKDEMKLITDQLIYNSKERDVVSLTGMPGLGKTTLAKKVYEHPYIVNHFQYRAWCCVSQEYHKKQLLLTILSCIVKLSDQIREKSDEDLSVMLHKELTGRRYLIIMDDIWVKDVFEDLQLFFPNNRNGSRLMLTSRDKLVGSLANYHHELGLLSEEESWVLLEQKVYLREKCPLELSEVGKEIAKKCRGLPLAVVVVGGLLSKSVKKLDLWKQVAGSLSLHTAHDSQHHGMEALDLSYKLLPDHLKPLFLYIGAFPEDKIILAEKLKWLWVAEGLVLKTDEVRSLEEEAEINLMDLTNRNLLMVAERRYDGRIKTVNIHDLLREMSIRKAEEEKFLQRINVSDKCNSLPDPVYCRYRVSISVTEKETPTLSTAYEDLNESHITYEQLQTFSMAPQMHSLLHFKSEDYIFLSEESVKSVVNNFKLLRVLHFESTNRYENLLRDVLLLVRLRYISIRISKNKIPSSISGLTNLETLIVKGKGTIQVPIEIWRMVKLRHIHINKRARFNDAGENFSKMENLETFSTPTICCGEEKKFMRRLSNVRKLSCIFVEHKSSRLTAYQYPQLESLDQLESLKMVLGGVKALFSGEFGLPSTLKKLTLLNFHLQWNQISRFQDLPSLEVLKLSSGAVDGELWELGSDDEFSKLKILKLDNLKIKEWIVCEGNFPCLEKMVFERCEELEEIPYSLGDFYSLVKVEVWWCSRSAATSALQIQKDQVELGNETLNIRILPTVQ